ncbi:hypothetical protein MMC25_002345 [Agyrium rufum]|nr:hypothetical protein [Agyrium rufum]
MKLSSFVLPLATAATLISASPLVERSTPSFAGSSNYYLHGVSASTQQTYLSTLHGWGAKVVRLWVTGLPNGCVKGSPTTYIPDLETTVRQYNDQVLAALDKVLAQLVSYGMKAIIVPHDAGVLKGANGCDAYCNKYGNSDNFYNSVQARADYDARVAYILNYVSPSSGKKWSQWWQAIAAFDIQNEPLIGSVDLLENNDPDDWLCGRAGKMKPIIAGSGVRIATGGIGGSEYCCDHEYNLLSKALYCSAIDIMSVHGYMTEASQWSYFIPSLEQQAAAQGKLLMIEEWGVDGSPAGQFDQQVAIFNNAGIPWLYWQITPGQDQTQTCQGSCCGTTNGNSYDGFEIGLTSSKGNVKAAISKADGTTAAQSWASIIY